jgi:hypothetical protein
MTQHTQDLRVAALQTDISWENPKVNIQLIQRQIYGVNDGTDLIILPEMWSSGFSMRPEHVAMIGTMHGSTRPTVGPSRSKLCGAGVKKKMPRLWAVFPAE